MGQEFGPKCQRISAPPELNPAIRASLGATAAFHADGCLPAGSSAACVRLEEGLAHLVTGAGIASRGWRVLSATAVHAQLVARTRAVAFPAVQWARGGVHAPAPAAGEAAQLETRSAAAGGGHTATGETPLVLPARRVLAASTMTRVTLQIDASTAAFGEARPAGADAARANLVAPTPSPATAACVRIGPEVTAGTAAIGQLTSTDTAPRVTALEQRVAATRIGLARHTAAASIAKWRGSAAVDITATAAHARCPRRRLSRDAVGRSGGRHRPRTGVVDARRRARAGGANSGPDRGPGAERVPASPCGAAPSSARDGESFTVCAARHRRDARKNDRAEQPAEISHLALLSYRPCPKAGRSRHFSAVLSGRHPHAPRASHAVTSAGTPSSCWRRRQDVVDLPLVIGVSAIVRRDDDVVAVEQEVSREPCLAAAADQRIRRRRQQSFERGT